MIWVPAPYAIEIAKDMATTSSYTSTNYKVERGCADPTSDRRFSFYLVNVKNKFLTLNPMQKQFPSVGSCFRIGALPPAVAQVFIRSVATKTEFRLPYFARGWRSLLVIVHRAVCYLTAVTAADQVSIVLEPEEGEYQGASAAAPSDGTSHGGRAKFAKRR